MLLLIRPTQGEDEEETISNLKMEAQTLKDRCDGHENKIKDLESRCDTHERIIEMLWKEIVGLKDSQNSLSTAYHGKVYDLIP
jgi:chromosome segregation ATPase